MQKKLLREYKEEQQAKIKNAPYADMVDEACVAELDREVLLNLGREYYEGVAPVVVENLGYSEWYDTPERRDWLYIKISGSFVCNGYYRIPANMHTGEFCHTNTGYLYFDNHAGFGKYGRYHAEVHTKIV
jgi:hypothetical protein